MIAKKSTRNFLRNVKNSLLTTLPDRKLEHVSSRISNNTTHCFVGYYDMDPANVNGECFYHEVGSKFTNDACPTVGKIKFNSIGGENTNRFADTEIITHALNWQLGSRCHWLDCDHIVFNDIDKKDNQIARIVEVKTGLERDRFELPFWQFSNTIGLAASLNFQRLRYKRPGYGYNGKYKFGDEEVLVVYSLATGSTNFYITLDEILSSVGLESFKAFDPYLNHISWSPDGGHFVTLLHYSDPLTQKRKIYPILVNPISGQILLLSKSGYFSHHIWLSNNEFLAFMDLGGEKTWAIWDKMDGWKKIMLNGGNDGHPTALRKNIISIDTYPDRFGLMHLRTFSTDTGMCLKDYGSIRNKTSYTGSQRCDLHPRYSKNLKKLIIDVPMSNAREILILDT